MTPDIILFYSYVGMFYILNTFNVFSFILNSSKPPNVLLNNYELIYIFTISYVIMKVSQFFYSIINNIFYKILNYLKENDYNNFQSHHFD